MAQTLEHNKEVTTVVPVTIPAFDDDLNIIQKLDDEPNDVGGLTAAELKAKFDEGNLSAQQYINNVLIPTVVADDLSEQARQAAEAERVANEIERVANETQRISAEIARENATTGIVAQASAQAAAAEESANRAAQAVLGQIPNGSLGPEKFSANSLSMMVRPNLLDNWYFGNPVNQRGKTSYKGTAGMYTIDRWKVMNANTEVVVNNDGTITVRNEQGDPYLQQLIEYPESLLGKTITLSVFTRDGFFSATSTLPTTFTNPETLYCNIDALCDVLVTSSTISVRLKGPGGDGWMFYAAKLELGPEQTLAHQENGKWVLNEIPNYGEQLARCQRYYIALGNLVRYPSTRLMSGEIDFIIPLPTTMRGGIPAMVGTCTVYNGATSQSGFTFSLAAAGVNAMAIRGSKASHGLTSANTYLAVSGVAFDANL